MISYIEYFSGCIGGIAGVTVGQPFDTIKVRLQTQGSTGPSYRGVWHCFTSIVKNESVFGLFKGMSSPLLGLTFINAIVFGVEAQTTAVLQSDTTFAHFLGGAFAGALQCVICSPMELAKTQMQVQGIGTRDRSHVLYKNSVDCIIKIRRSHGLSGCYKGMILTLIRETPAFGFYFASYDMLTTRVFNINKAETYQWHSIMKMMLSGGFSGIVSWVSTYPVDVIKSRFQADNIHKPKYNGSLDCLIKSYKAHGHKVFVRYDAYTTDPRQFSICYFQAHPPDICCGWSNEGYGLLGLNSTIIRAFPVNGATFAVVQVTSQYLYNRRNGVIP